MLRLLIYLLGTCCVISCTTVKMATSNEALQKQEYRVQKKKPLFGREHITFGDYKTIAIKRSWIKGQSSRYGWSVGNVTDANYSNILSVQFSSRKQDVRFEMVSPTGDTSETFCMSRVNAQDIQIGKRSGNVVNVVTSIAMGLKDESKYYVQIYTNKNASPWEFVLDNNASMRKPGTYVGLVSESGGSYYTIVPVNRLIGRDGTPADMPFGAIGFEIRNKDGRALAAVSKFDKGVVYLQNVADQERFLLANICAALLLQEPIG